METNEITNTEDSNRRVEEKYVKNPKKVAAGKALAKKNAEGRKLKKEKELNSNSSQVDVSRLTDISTIYNEIQSIAGLVGVGFTLYHGWKFFYPKKVVDVSLRAESMPRDSDATPSVSPPPSQSPRKSIDF